jgi:hypothetical protein
MLAQNFRERIEIFGCFQTVEIVRLLAHIQPCRPKLFPPLSISYSGATPIVTLKQNQRAIKAQSGVCRCRPRIAECVAQARDHFNSPLRRAGISAFPSQSRIQRMRLPSKLYAMRLPTEAHRACFSSRQTMSDYSWPELVKTQPCVRRIGIPRLKIADAVAIFQQPENIFVVA